MTVSSDTLHKLGEAVERLATGSGTATERAQQALIALARIKSEEFADNIAGVPWSFVISTSKAIRNGDADAKQVDKFNSSIWQLFTAYRPK
jgi:predicted metal-dependent phosphoesterase TrpH